MELTDSEKEMKKNLAEAIEKSKENIEYLEGRIAKYQGDIDHEKVSLKSMENYLESEFEESDCDA